MDLIENAKRIAEIDVLIKKEGTSTVPTSFDKKDNFSPSVKALVNKTLSELKQPSINYDIPDETPYTNIHTQFDFIVKGSNSQLRMFEIPITEGLFDINNKYDLFIQSVQEILPLINTHLQDTEKIVLPSLTTFVMQNINIINNNIKDGDISTLHNDKGYQATRETLYASLVELVVDENTKADEAEAKAAAALAAASVGGQKGGGFNVAEVLKMKTLLDISPEQIDDDMYTSSLFYILTIKPFPKIVESTTILSETISDLTQQLVGIDEFFQTLVKIDKKKDLLPKIQTCFFREINIINPDLVLLKSEDFEKISQQYVTALTYLKTKKELQDISDTMITRDKAQEDNIIREQIVKRANDALAGMVLIEVDTFDTSFKGEKSRNIKIVIPAKKTKHMPSLYNAFSDGGSYTTSSSIALFYKKCKKLIACDFYKDSKIKDISVTHYDTTFTTFKLKEVVPRSGEVYLIGDDNKSYDMKKCFFTTSEIQKSFGIGSENQYMEGFSFGNFEGGEKYNPGYYVNEAFYFLNDPTNLHKPLTREFKDMSKKLSNIIGCVLSYDGATGTVQQVYSDNNVITKVIFDNDTINIENVFATGAQLQKIYSDFNLNSVKKLVFIESKVVEIKKKPNTYRDISIYSPGVQFEENTSIPLFQSSFTNASVKGISKGVPFDIDSDLTSKDYKMTYINDDDGGITYKTGRLVRVSKNVEKYIFTIETNTGIVDFGMDACFFTKYQWEKILGNQYVDFEGFFIGWCDPTKFTSIADKEMPLYLPGYYWTNDKKEIICKFFMDGKDETVNDKYHDDFHQLPTINNNLSYDATEEQPIVVLTNNDGTISGIKFASDDVSIDKIFVQQHQIVKFYPTLYDLNDMYFDSDIATESFCERQIIIFKISRTNGINFSIMLKRDMGFDISISGNKQTLTNIADENGNLHQITKILITYSNCKSSFFFIDGTTQYDITAIFLYENELKKLINSQNNIANGLIGFSLEKNTNLARQPCDVITLSPNSFFPGYQLGNEFKLLCNSINIPTVLTKSRVDSFTGNEISFLNLNGAEEDGVIESYTCNDKDEIIGVIMRDERVINIERCFVKDDKMRQYYKGWAASLETYLNGTTIFLSKIASNATVFSQTRPIDIYIFTYQEVGSPDYIPYTRCTNNNFSEPIPFINSNTNINSLKQIYPTFQTTDTEELANIKFDKGSFYLNNKIPFSDTYFYSYQLLNSYQAGLTNAAVNLRLFMINSETIIDQQSILDKYNPANNELLYLYGYFDGLTIEVGCNITLLDDNNTKTKATINTNVNSLAYTRYDDINNDINNHSIVIRVSNYQQSNDKMSAIQYLNGNVQQSIDIKKCFKISTEGIVINNTPLKIISPANLETFLTSDASIIANIIALSNIELSDLPDSIITVITHFITAAQLNALDNDRIIALYDKTSNQQELTDKLNATKAVTIFGMVDPTDPTKKRVNPTVKDIQNLKEDIIDNLHLLPADFSEKNDIIANFTDAQIDELTKAENRAKLYKLEDMSPADINSNLENMSAKYLKLLLKKIPPLPASMDSLVAAIDKHLTIPQIKSLQILEKPYYNKIAKKIINQESDNEKTILLKNITDKSIKLREALEEITDKGEVVKLLNNEDIINKLSDTQVPRIVNTLRNNDILFLNNCVTTRLVNKDALIDATTLDASQMATIIDMINSDRLNDKLTRVDEAFKQNFANALRKDQIQNLTADKIQVLRTQVGNQKLLELFSKLDKAQLESLTTEQINKLLEIPEFYGIFKDKLSPSEIIQLNNPELITQLMADTADKQGLVDGLGNISNLDVASINALEADLSPEQCKAIYDKVADKSNLSPGQFNALTKKFSSINWYNEINLLDLKPLNSVIKIMTPQEIESRKNEISNSLLTNAAWNHFLLKIDIKTIFESDAAKINALINGFGLYLVQVQRLNDMEFADLDALDTDVKQELKKNIKKDDIKLLTDLKKEGLGFQRGVFTSGWSGGKTKRFKTKQNKTRRL